MEEIVESAQIEDVYLDWFYLTIDKLITHKTQTIFYWTAQHCGFITYSLK